jgi:hypothetical protein
VSSPYAIDNPVNKNFEGLVDIDTHLMSYKLAPVRLNCAAGSPQNEFLVCQREEDCGGVTGQTKLCRKPSASEIHKNLLINNQFGKMFVDTLVAQLLLVPSSKGINPPPALDPLDIDHFKCYSVRASKRNVCERDPSRICKTDLDCGEDGSCVPMFSKRTVNLEDQFQEQVFVVVKPTRLCAPAQKKDEQMVDPKGTEGTHLMCYKVKGAIRHTSKKVYVNNQFGPEQLYYTLIEDELCVPSTNRATSSYELTG